MRTLYTNPTMQITPGNWASCRYSMPPRYSRLATELYSNLKILRHDVPILSTTNDDSFRIAEADDVERVDADHPWVKPMVGENQLGQFQASYSFLALCRKQAHGYGPFTTYGCKYDVEHFTGFYVSDGAFIRAALLAGFMLGPPDKVGSCKLNLQSDAIHNCMVDLLASVCKHRP
jgi:hypothetical protein